MPQEYVLVAEMSVPYEIPPEILVKARLMGHEVYPPDTNGAYVLNRTWRCRKWNCHLLISRKATPGGPGGISWAWTWTQHLEEPCK